MEQTDRFYEQLPFTLQQQHLDAEYVIFGTGLQQSALAAYLSKMQGKKILVFDQQKTYGSCMKTITLKQLYQLTNNKLQQRLYNFYVPPSYIDINQNFYNNCLEKKAYRGYNIDIQPSVFFGNSITCQSLKQADMDKYMDFRLVNHLLKYQKGKLQQVPLSKGKIFQSKSLGLIQKKALLTSLHTLIKLYQKYSNIEEDQNSTKQFDKGFGQVSQELFEYFNMNLENNFVILLEKITKKNKKIMDFIAYIVCNYQYNYQTGSQNSNQQCFKIKNFIKRFGKFINSCGIYGESPYLYVDNGMGDIPQAFSRISSIFGGTFILHPKISIDQITTKQDTVEIKSNIAHGKKLNVKQIFYGQTFETLYESSKKELKWRKQQVFRLLILSKKLGNEEQCPSIGYFIDCKQFKNPVSLFMFDDYTHSCPSDMMLYQFSTILSENEMKKQNQQKQKLINEKINSLIDKLVQIRGPDFKESMVFISSYIRKSNRIIMESEEQYKLNKQKHIFLNGYGGLDIDSHFQNFIKIVGEKQNYFRKKNAQQNELQQDEDQDTKNSLLQRLDDIKFKDSQQNQQQNKDKKQEKQEKQQHEQKTIDMENNQQV